MNWDGYGMGGMWGSWVFGTLLMVGLVLLVVFAVRALGGGTNAGPGASGPGPADQPPGRARAREVLDERYARGELTTEEYRERLQTLSENT